MTAQSNSAIRTQEFFTQVMETPVQPGFFDMPATPYPSLLSSLMRRWLLLTRSTHWWVGSLSLAFLFYGIFVALALLDQTIFQLKSEEKWATFYLPLTLLYLTLVTTRLVHLLHNTVKTLRQQAAVDSCQPTVMKTYAQNRTLEALIMTGGAVIGLNEHILAGQTWSVVWQNSVGGALIGALLAWHSLSWSYRTWRIFQLYRQARYLHHITPWVLFRTVATWSMGVSLFFGGLLLFKGALLHDLRLDLVTTHSVIIVLLIQATLLIKVTVDLTAPYITTFLDLPAPPIPGLLDRLMAHWMAFTHIPSYFMAALSFALVLYLPGLVIAAGDNTLYSHESGASWWNRLLFPAMFLYQVMWPRLVRYLFYETVDDIQKSVSITPKRFKQLLLETYKLNQGHEVLAFGVGVVSSFILTLLFDYTSYLALVYSAIASSVIFGLISWQVYTGLTKTKHLSQLLNHLQGLNLARQEDTIGPIFRWNVIMAASFIGAIVLSAFFIPNLRHVAPITVYTVLILATILVFVFNRVPTALLPWFRIARIIAIFIFVAALGSMGFYYLESANQPTLTPLDALYMTIITMTTIGYGDVTPKTDLGKLFTIGLSLFAVGICTYAVSALASFIVEGDINELIGVRKMTKEISKLSNHIIICGAGGVGLQIAHEFYRTRTPFIIIDQDPTAFEDLLHRGDIFCIQGDATKDEILLSAGVERARGIVAALSDDKENAFVILTARALNADPKLRIIARLTQEDNLEKLKRAGANEIVSPHSIGGLRMASIMLRPSVVSFLDSMLRAEELTGQTLRIEEITFDELNVPALIGREQLSIIDVGRHTQLLVIAIKSESGEYEYKPRSDTLIQRGDVLIVLGTPQEVAYARGY